MGNNSINENENILVVVDQQNIIHIDPNSVVLNNGEISSRLVNHENLVTYVNLEADLVPRSALFSENGTNTLTSVAFGTFNMMRNQGGKEGEENNFDTSWSEVFTPSSSNNDKPVGLMGGLNYDPTAQSFGISSINIVIKGANAIPQVSMNFIDVRGKTLFESAESSVQDSPYVAFFHQPWPIFYLTIKGYYGKAIRYRLQLVDFKTKFNGNTGNFEITTKFVGSTYAFLNDILFQNAVNAPYMYMVETGGDYKTNTKTGFVEKTVSKSTRGYQILKSVYSEYKAKGYIPKDFPIKTLRDLIMTANSLDKILETTLFSSTVDPIVLGGVAEYDQLLDTFEKRVIAWAGRYLGDKVETINNVDYYGLNKTVVDQNKTTSAANTADIITGTTNTTSLQSILNKCVSDLEKNTAFGKNVVKKKYDINTFSISLAGVTNASSFAKPIGGNFCVAINELVAEIKKVQTVFVKSRKEIEDKVEDKMNTIIKNPKEGGFGFSPTIRNIFAVILANADTYIRLMKDVHTKAIRNSDERKKIKVTSTNKNESLYPWPLVSKNSDKNTPTPFYPGDPAISKEIKGDDFNIWPEVEFVETYNSVATKRVDTLSGKEIPSSDLTFVFPDDAEASAVNNVSSLFKIDNPIPYSNKSLSNIFYEIYERAFYLTSFDSFTMGKGLKILYQKEFETINNCTKDDIDLREILSKQITSVSKLQEYLKLSSPNDRYVYFRDRLPTVDYIKEVIDIDFELTEYKTSNTGSTTGATTSSNYDEIQSSLDSYNVENYRSSIYPFSSEYYKSYVNPAAFNKLNFKNIFKVNENGNFISSPVDIKAWVKNGYTDNIFTNNIDLSVVTRNMLNTPYFHKQLFNDFFKGGVEERYTGSAYLLLNSLPFKDLDDEIAFNNGKDKILMSSLFREVGSTNYVPYHLLLKWGSMYHRYKKYLVEGIDIISGVTSLVDTSKFFDNGSNTVFSLTGITPSLTAVTHASQQIVGLYPYYHGIFHQIVNGYSFYNPSGFTKTTVNYLPSSFIAGLIYSDTITTNINKIVQTYPIAQEGVALTSIIDNSKFSTLDKRYTILPSNGIASFLNVTDDYTRLEQDSFRIILDDGDLYTNPDYTIEVFPTYKEKLISVKGKFSLEGDKRKVADLIATFSPALLDEMEKMFIDFSSLNLKLDITTPITGSTDTARHDYVSFQELLKDIVSIPQTNIDFSKDGYPEQIVKNQNEKLKEITGKILSDKNLEKLTIGNPKQIDNYILYGLTGTNQFFNDGSFDSAQLTADNYKLIELYIGEHINDLIYAGYPNLYADFFRVNDIEVNPDNIYRYREFARIYAGWFKDEILNNISFVPTKDLFKAYITDILFTPHNMRFIDFLDNLLRRFPDLAPSKAQNTVTIYSGYNDAKTLKLDLYQFFKSFNDKWIAGNAIGQRNLMDEFLFLDRANRDIGNEAFISLERLISLSDEKNIKVDLYSAISILIQGTNFDLRTLPAYVNFYGTNTSNKRKITPSKNLARNLFGTFLEVDYQESSPKIILQYVGGTSKYLDLERISKQYKFKNDSFKISDVNNNPLLVEPKLFMDADLSKSNRVVSFEVNFGDQGNGIFKSISLDQSTYKNTTESAIAQERLARSQSGGGTYQVDNGLFDIYKTASYECDITMMGNVMIQPTMYFYLANVPMFHGTYLIIDVNHSIKGNNVETTIKGVRISNSTLPKMQDSFIASYRPLFSRVLSAAIKRKQLADNKINTEKTYTLKDAKNISIDPGQTLAGEDMDRQLVKSSGFYNDLIPYNGVKYVHEQANKEEKYIQLIEKTKGDEWLRTRVVLMGGNLNPIPDTKEMALLSPLKNYGQINTTVYEYYSTRYTQPQKNISKILSYNTEFLNPRTGTNYLLVTNINSGLGKYDGPVDDGPYTTADKDLDSYGIAMNSHLMRKLKLNEGDIVYFRLKK